MDVGRVHIINGKWTARPEKEREEVGNQKPISGLASVRELGFAGSFALQGCANPGGGGALLVDRNRTCSELRRPQVRRVVKVKIDISFVHNKG